MKNILIAIIVLAFVIVGVQLVSTGKTKTTTHDKIKTNNEQVDSIVPVSAPVDSYNSDVVSAEVGFITVDAEVITPENKERIQSELGDEMNTLKLDMTKTNILLLLNNHRIDLSSFAYGSMVQLDDERALNWQPLSSAIGGHHVAGVLTFEKNDTPGILSITDLPVDEIRLDLSKDNV